MGVLVLALNPSIDAEWRVDGVQWEEKNTIQAERRWAGGKGINVARWLRHLGDQPCLLLPLGGDTGAELARYLREEKFSTRIVSVREASRVNTIVSTASQGQLRFNQSGPELSRAELRAILEETSRLTGKASCVVLSGSLPRGVPADVYGRITKRACRAGVKTILDCDGEALRAAVGAHPFLVKPNAHELAQWSGRKLGSEASLLSAARGLSKATRGWVLVSRGPAGGLLVNDREGATFYARPPRLKAVHTIGAGDAMVAAVAQQIEAGAGPAEWLRWGVAAGSAATQCVAGKLPRRGLVEAILARIIPE
ncbi:MAG: tagatose-6-phosphate kinase [Pedosphaera sp.]|nr:tagatose-6-phosphate kinase [Pedosphaera sp.]